MVRIIYVSFLLCTALFIGCAKSGPDIAPVSGRITVDGRPMQNVDIVFQPEKGKSPSYGRTDKDGHYVLAYGRGMKGALVGWHRVGISVSRELVHNPPHIKNDELRREVKSTGNEFNFDVTTEAKQPAQRLEPQRR